MRAHTHTQRSFGTQPNKEVLSTWKEHLWLEVEGAVFSPCTQTNFLKFKFLMETAAISLLQQHGTKLIYKPGKKEETIQTAEN